MNNMLKNNALNKKTFSFYLKKKKYFLNHLYMSKRGPSKSKPTVSGLQKQISKLRKEQKRLTKKNPKEIVKGVTQGSQLLTGFGKIQQIIPQSLHQDTPVSFTKFDMRFVVQELTPDVANIIRVICFWYRADVLAGSIVPPSITDVMELDDAKSSTDYTNRKNIRVFYDTKLRGTVAGEASSTTANFNMPNLKTFTRTKKYKDGFKADAVDNNDLVWHPYMALIADSYNLATTVVYSVDYFYYD